MEGNLSLRVKDEISIKLDHKVHGQLRPCIVFLCCREGRIRIRINIIGKPHYDDVGVIIENGRLVTVSVKPVHAFNRTFCIDGPSAELDYDQIDEPKEPVIDSNIKADQAKPHEADKKTQCRLCSGQYFSVEDDAEGICSECRKKARPDKAKPDEKNGNIIIAEADKADIPIPKPDVIMRWQKGGDKVEELQCQLKAANHRTELLQEHFGLEVNVAAENDRQLRQQITDQHQELDRLREIEKAYNDVVAFFSSSPHTDGPKMSACQRFVKHTIDTIRARTEVRLRCEIQGLVSAVKQLGQQVKNEQGSRIYYQELVHKIRAVMVGGCEKARGCNTDDLPGFVKAAVTIAHHEALGIAIANLKGHHI